ncbi:hypothetical protein LIER_32343 [Lithospermum erythrorhizon]|uniref:Reverse transcriptase domain-containing protein n=1 Tax=Lithospermum erythrorhizon TaxID=34254 RepID=A0AAV3RWP4_LITER
MAGGKAPGPDSMSPKFFQHYWDIMGEDLGQMVLNFLNHGIFLRKFNFTLIILIPKVEKPINMTQFRPIALCNSVAKVIAKMLATRLKRVLPNVISESQNAFVPNKLITGNVLLSYELHHVIKHKKSGPLGLMSIKLDMLKAYDKIEWSFLNEMMIQLNFSNKWINLVMTYVESISYSVLINGEQTGYFKPRKGLS